MDQAAGQHLANVQARHDGLAGARVVGQQETQARLRQHVLVHCDPLVGQRVYQCRLCGERWVEEMAERQTFGFSHDLDNLGIG